MLLYIQITEVDSSGEKVKYTRIEHDKDSHKKLHKNHSHNIIIDTSELWNYGNYELEAVTR